MGILTRFKDIMSSNLNALLDKAEDPEKMIDQYLRNLEGDLGKVKAETAAIMADETRCKRVLSECQEEVAKMQRYAQKAVMAGNDGDAREFLTKKAQLVSKQANLQQAYDAAAANAARMRQMHDKLVRDISDLNSRRDAVKAKMAVAKTQERINKLGASMDGAAENLSAFDRMEAKANKLLDQANAMAELNASAEDSDLEALAQKYDMEECDEIERELESLKSLKRTSKSANDAD
jgi:phage shock protein A